MVLKDDGEENASHLVSYFMCKKKWPEIRIHRDSWTVLNRLAL